jgi:nitronate monooxygenase
VQIDLRDRLAIEYPVVQAGLGGGLSRAELAGAVSRAGGLGTVGILEEPAAFRAEIRRARDLAAGKPISANLLFPVMRRAHVEACVAERVPVVSLFFGFDRCVVEALHAVGSVVLHQVGTVEQARRAIADGADGVVVQGDGAGGHLLATAPLERILPEIRDAVGERSVLAAGGIHDGASAARAFSLGADGVWVGTRFLLTPESHAHPAYKERLLAATSTLVTRLFGLGWDALHRVVPNAATDRWCAGDPLGPRWVRALYRVTEPVTRLLPPSRAGRFVTWQRPERPFFTPVGLVRGMDPRLVDVTPLYAGECVTHLRELVSAAAVVRELAEAARSPAKHSTSTSP